MNVERGLFRGWVFVSAIWIAVVIAFGYALVPEGIEHQRYQYVATLKQNVDPWKLNWSLPHYDLVKSPAAEKIEPTFSQVDPSYWSRWEDERRAGKLKAFSYAGDGELYLDSAWNDNDERYLRKAFESSRWQRWVPALAKWSLGAVLPPVLLLIFGLGAVWVSRGFRSAK